MYCGNQHWRPKLGLQPTDADRKFVRTLSVMGTSTRAICVRLGERFNLGRPMAKSTLYYWFRWEMVRQVRGSKRSLEAKRNLSGKLLVASIKRSIEEVKREARMREHAERIKRDEENNGAQENE